MKKIITFIILLTIINIANISLAIENLTLSTENENVNINESFKIYVNIGEIKTASYTLNIYFDNSKVEYLSGSENTNVVDNTQTTNSTVSEQVNSNQTDNTVQNVTSNTVTNTPITNNGNITQ